MKWFMHQSAANRDAKLKKVLIKYGAEGYGLYWYCLEHVCANVDPRLSFEIEDDAEILAHDLKIDSMLVSEMMRYMVNLGLFEESEGVISCLKLARYLGDKNTRNPDLKAIIQGQKHHLSATVRDSPRLSALEESRGEEIRKKDRAQTSRFTPPTPEEVQEYLNTKGITEFDGQRFCDHYEAVGWMRGKNKIKNWKACVATWNKNQPTSEQSTRIYGI